MLPLSIDLRIVPTLLIGGGPAALKRLRLIDGAGASALRILATDADPDMIAAAGDRLERRLPEAADFAAARIVFVADVHLDEARSIAEAARAAGALVNVEDVLDLCDFHVPATVRRGDLAIAISTGGKSPGLARLLKAHLGRLFGPEWEGHLDELAEARLRWRAEGRGPGEVSRLTAELIRDRKWLD
jgi:precorrin-2 dehydrogenase/sirohydrochlorin ferrochelatase